MMGYAVDISKKLKEMKNKQLHPHFEAITDRLIQCNQLDMLEPMLQIIVEYDKVIRDNVGLRQTNINLNSKLYGRSNQYGGGYYKRKSKEGQL